MKLKINWKEKIKKKKGDRVREYDIILVNFILKMTLFAKVLNFFGLINVWRELLLAKVNLVVLKITFAGKTPIFFHSYYN